MRYGIAKRLRRGDSLLLFLTFRCTLQCEYCALKYIDGIYPTSKEIQISEWKRIVKSFPRRIREIKITGGEPMIMPYFSEFVNWLIDEGYFVIVFSNLTVKKDIKKSNKLLIISTNHKVGNFNLPHYKEHRVKVEQIEFAEGHADRVKDMCYREYGDTCTGFIYSPEGQLYTCVNDMYKAHV